MGMVLGGACVVGGSGGRGGGRHLLKVALIFDADALGNGGIRDYDRCFEH